MVASTRAEQKINTNALSAVGTIFYEVSFLFENRIINSQDGEENFAISSLVTIKTVGAGDCAFHARAKRLIGRSRDEEEERRYYQGLSERISLN